MRFSLKKRKPIVYITLVLYALLSGIIMGESCLPKSVSGERSEFFANISAWFVNTFAGPQIPDAIEPTSIGNITDSSYLGKDEAGNANIAIGTTSAITIPVKYPNKPKTNDVYDYTYPSLTRKATKTTTALLCRNRLRTKP